MRIFVLVAVRTLRRRLALLAVATALLASVLMLASDWDAPADMWTAVTRHLPDFIYFSWSPYCRRVRRRIATSVEQWVERSGDPELSALFQPLFTQRRLVIWSADYHVALIADLKVRVHYECESNLLLLPYAVRLKTRAGRAESSRAARRRVRRSESGAERELRAHV